MQCVEIGPKDTIVNKSAGYGVIRVQPRSSDSGLPNERRERQEPKISHTYHSGNPRTSGRHCVRIDPRRPHASHLLARMEADRQSR